MPPRPRHGTAPATSTQSTDLLPTPSSSSDGTADTMIDEELDARLGPRDSRRRTAGDEDQDQDKAAAAPPPGTAPIWVEWDGPGDPKNPLNWSKRRKWLVTTLGLMYTSIVSVSVTSYSISEGSVVDTFGARPILATLGVTLWTIGFGTAPLLLAPLSELFGRKLIYCISGFGFVLFYLPLALAPNIGAVLASRFLIGVVGSSSISLVGGSIADVWAGKDRGFPLALFSWAAFAFTGLGATMYSYAEVRYGFRMISWCMMGTAGVQCVLLVLFVPETRASVLLARKAAALRAETGDPRYQSKEVALRGSFGSMLVTNLSRPVRILATEVIVIMLTLWISFAWGVLYLLLGSLVIVFQDLYGFSTGPLGMVYATQAVGASIGLAVDWFVCAPLYRKHVARLGPEARLYCAMIGGIVFPIGIWIYVFTSYAKLHWMGPIVGVTIIYTGLYLVYLSVFAYLSDSYTLFSSSVLSSMSMVRNVIGSVFPLFTSQMYNRLGVQGAGGLTAGLGTVLSCTPFLLFYFGRRLRARSPFARQLAMAEAAREQEIALADAKEKGVDLA